MALRLNCAPLKERAQIREVLGVVAFVPLLCIVSSAAISIAADLTPSTYDYVLYHADRSLCLDTFAAARALLAQCASFSPLCHDLQRLATFYCRLPRSAPRASSGEGFPVDCGDTGHCRLYSVPDLPGRRPAYRFAAFPKFAPALAEAPLHAALLPPVARNAMPSLHIGWTVLCCWNVWPLGRMMRLLSIVFLAATAMATIGSGQHYAIDLIVAVPLCVAVQAGWNYRRAAAASVLVVALAMAIVLCWVIGARCGLLGSLAAPTIRL
ncbi:MAG TPA: phosphatase PAP2 family protein [Bryobacteraceae bacterium]